MMFYLVLVSNLQRLIDCCEDVCNEEPGHDAGVLVQPVNGRGQEDTQCGGEVLLRMTGSGRDDKRTKS